MHWQPTSVIPSTASKYRLTFMFHEIQDFPDVELDELEMELQYCMVEHVHRMAIGAPLKLGEEQGDQQGGGNGKKGKKGKKGIVAQSNGSNGSNGSVFDSPEEEEKEEEEEPFILCPIKHVRMHYIASTEAALSDHFNKTKIPLRLLVRARRGEAFATAVGNTSIRLDRLASQVSAIPNEAGSKVTVMLPVGVCVLATCCSCNDYFRCLLADSNLSILFFFVHSSSWGAGGCAPVGQGGGASQHWLHVLVFDGGQRFVFGQ